MRFSAAAAVFAAGLFLASQPARADMMFQVSATLQYGGTLTGTFSTNDALNTVTASDIVASAGPGSPGFTFTGFTYTLTDSSVTAESGTLIQFDSTAPTGQELRLDFSLPITDAGAALTTGSYESELSAGSRTVVSGAVTAAPAGTGVTPEPSSIALLGTGLLGVAGVVRKRFA